MTRFLAILLLATACYGQVTNKTTEFITVQDTTGDSTDFALVVTGICPSTNCPAPIICPTCPPQTNCAAYTCPTCPTNSITPADSNMAAGAIGQSTISFNWQLPATPVSNQLVVMSTGAFALLPGNATNYNMTGLAPSTTVTAYVCAVTYDLMGVFKTAPATVATNTLLAPTSLVVMSTTSTSAVVSWQYTGTCQGFYTQWAASSSGPWQQRGTTTSNVTSYTFINLSPSTTNFFHVYAYNANSLSPASAPVVGVTTP